MTTRCVLWDFGDTLVDQDWMLTAPEGVPGWPQAWAEVARGDLECRWNRGEVGSGEIARRVAARLGMSLSDTVAHIQRCCRSIRFFDLAMDAVRSCGLPQAIVTVNPDVFTSLVVPHYALDRLFPVIVTSWQEGTVDKTALCLRALRLLRGAFEPSEALLIDNIAANVWDWKRCDGRGYTFVGEAELAADLPSLLRGR